MLRVLHYFPKENAMIRQHVTMLTEAMGTEVEQHSATEANDARTLLEGGQYDLLHLHGCWRNSSRQVVAWALKTGARLILTPHGQLEPWVKEENRWKEKLPKQLLYQRDIVKKAYAVIIQGQMEQECMNRLDWNKRTVVIRNAVVTSSITASDMARQTAAIYRKVMDSNQLELMDNDMRKALKSIIKAGITGDRRWLDEEENTLPVISQWRQLLCYAHQERISDVLQRGLRILSLEAPDLDVTKTDCFMPDNYEDTGSISSTIGNQFATENDRLIATFRYLRKLTARKQLGIRHLVELDRELRQYGCEEEQLSEDLKVQNLWKLTSRLMQLMSELTGLTEGFMPVTPTNDRTSRQMRRQVDERLKI